MKNKILFIIFVSSLSITFLNASAKDKVKELIEQNQKVNEQMIGQIEKTNMLINLYYDELVVWENSIFNNELIIQMKVLNESN